MYKRSVWTSLLQAKGCYGKLYSMVQNKMATAILGFELCSLTTIPERTDVGVGQGGSEEQARRRPNPFAEGRATGQLVMGSRVITVGMWRGSLNGRARNERDPGLSRNRFKANDLWKKVRLIWTLLYAIRIVHSAIATYFLAAAILFCTME